MSVDTELEAWRQEWQSAAPPMPDLAAMVKRQTRFMRIMLASEVLVTVVVGGVTTALAVRSPRADMFLLAAAVWVFIGSAWIFALRTRRGCWAPAALNTSAFVDVSIRRCRASLAAGWFGAVLYCCEMLFCLAWIYHHKSEAGRVSLGTFLTSTTVIATAIGTLALVPLLIWYRRRKLSDLARLRKLANGQAMSRE